MQTETWSIDRVKPYERNPRQNKHAVDAVANSLRAFGFRQPIVVDAEGTIIVGHTRYLAALSLGMTDVPIHQATDLTAEQAGRTAYLMELDPAYCDVIAKRWGAFTGQQPERIPAAAAAPEPEAAAV